MTIYTDVKAEVAAIVSPTEYINSIGLMWFVCVAAYNFMSFFG